VKGFGWGIYILYLKNKSLRHYDPKKAVSHNCLTTHFYLRVFENLRVEKPKEIIEGCKV